MERLPSDFANELYGDQMLAEFDTAIAEPEVEDMYLPVPGVIANEVVEP